MKIEHLEENLYDYVTRRMDEKDYRLTEEHVRMCEECQREVSELMETLVLLDKFQPPPLSVEFKEKVRQRLYELTLPSKPLSYQIREVFYRIKEWFQIPPVKRVLQGAAVVATLLLTLTIYKTIIEKPYDIEKIPRDLKITLTEVKNPIIIETENIDASLEQLKKLIQVHDGNLLQTIFIDKGIRVTFSLKKEKEPSLFSELKQLGKVWMEKEDFKDKQGNIVMVLKEKKKR